MKLTKEQRISLNEKLRGLRQGFPSSKEQLKKELEKKKRDLKATGRHKEVFKVLEKYNKKLLEKGAKGVAGHIAKSEGVSRAKQKAKDYEVTKEDYAATLDLLE